MFSNCLNLLFSEKHKQRYVDFVFLSNFFLHLKNYIIQRHSETQNNVPTSSLQHCVKHNKQYKLTFAFVLWFQNYFSCTQSNFAFICFAFTQWYVFVCFFFSIFVYVFIFTQQYVFFLLFFSSLSLCVFYFRARTPN